MKTRNKYTIIPLLFITLYVISFVMTGCKKEEKDEPLPQKDKSISVNITEEGKDISLLLGDILSTDTGYTVVDSDVNTDNGYYSYVRLDSNNARNGGKKDVSAATIIVEAHINIVCPNHQVPEKQGDIETALKNSTLPFAVREKGNVLSDKERNIIEKSLSVIDTTDYAFDSLIRHNDLDKTFLAVNSDKNVFIRFDFHTVGAGDTKITIDTYNNVQNDMVDVMFTECKNIDKNTSLISFFVENNSSKDLKIPVNVKAVQNKELSKVNKEDLSIVGNGTATLLKGEKKGYEIPVKVDWNSDSIYFEIGCNNTDTDFVLQPVKYMWYKDENTAWNTFKNDIESSTGIPFDINSVENIDTDAVLKSETYYKLSSGTYLIEGEGYDNSFIRFNPNKWEIYTGAFVSGTEFTADEDAVYMFAGPDISQGKINIKRQN